MPRRRWWIRRSGWRQTRGRGAPHRACPCCPLLRHVAFLIWLRSFSFLLSFLTTSCAGRVSTRWPAPRPHEGMMGDATAERPFTPHIPVHHMKGDRLARRLANRPASRARIVRRSLCKSGQTFSRSTGQDCQDETLTAVDVAFAQAFLASPKGVMKAPKPPPTPPQGATPNSKRRLKGQGVADRETKLVLTAEEKLGELLSLIHI